MADQSAGRTLAQGFGWRLDATPHTDPTGKRATLFVIEAPPGVARPDTSVLLAPCDARALVAALHDDAPPAPPPERR